jgi:hypothetical protein
LVLSAVGAAASPFSQISSEKQNFSSRGYPETPPIIRLCLGTLGFSSFLLLQEKKDMPQKLQENFLSVERVCCKTLLTRAALTNRCTC